MTIRRDFPALNPAQIQQILSEYQLGPGKTRPRGWFPPPEEVEPALRTGIDGCLATGEGKAAKSLELQLGGDVMMIAWQTSLHHFRHSTSVYQLFALSRY